MFNNQATCDIFNIWYNLHLKQVKNIGPCMGINVFHLFHLPQPPGQPLLIDSSCQEHCVVKDSAVEKDCVESGSGFREKEYHDFTYGSWAQTG